MSLSFVEGLALARELGARDHHLAVLVTLRPDGQPSTSVVNAGVLAHPVSGRDVVAFVARGATAKLANLRTNPRVSLVFRAGWEWVAVHGRAELAGPDDPLPGLGHDDDLRTLLRDIYTSAGGHHHDLTVYDEVMAAERRTAVLVTPTRFTTNPPGTEHEEHP
ncbi:TIGR03618 family F420-dependent PPOX class oxidoreductase [Goodfellowiella coeruleoviolacea]|uniref:PPOX class probable F420-dependent enzyme n=1 Tax=Goodfellowiella coeruleoviolacea TaxID=334858 RepID=A0AAE3GLY0_9PSEU|nr:TIGR03618 family F420-dependent PPOX class oxidoreductase [Goodfellowiella coeruleoviolacea]MCP2169719.1 PPOX class probable F420-dependent enzyme [Goodfellowiella coeruleoviolacea]